MNARLEVWNTADEASAFNTMIACCASLRWASAMAALRPIASVADLSATADRVWNTLDEADWLEAFAAHPRIGARKDVYASTKSAAWARQEQSSTATATEGVLEKLAEGNARYEAQFGFTYIVCATGKSAEEMLSILERRLASDRGTELREAAEQQRQIMQIRLGKWLVE